MQRYALPHFASKKTRSAAALTEVVEDLEAF